MLFHHKCRTMLEGLFITVRSRANLDELHVEHEHGVWFDQRRRRASAVCELALDDEFPLVAFLHQLHRLGPARDDLIRRERRRLTALIRRVKLFAFDRSPRVMTLASRRLRRRRTPRRAALQHAILQSARERRDALLELIRLRRVVHRARIVVNHLSPRPLPRFRPIASFDRRITRRSPLDRTSR